MSLQLHLFLPQPQASPPIPPAPGISAPVAQSAFWAFPQYKDRNLQAARIAQDRFCSNMEGYDVGLLKIFPEAEESLAYVFIWYMYIVSMYACI